MSGFKKKRKKLILKGNPPYFVRQKNTGSEVNLVNSKYKLRKGHGNKKQFSLEFS
jgi:hypothetical protein